MTAEPQPPSFDPINPVSLSAQKDSKILSIAVYAGRAELTRLFKFNVKTGQNQVTITELPLAIDQQSFRVEGRGAATIHDVTISNIEQPPAPTTSDKLEELESDLTKTTKALARAQKSLSSLETYLSSLNSQNLDASKLQTIVETYDATAATLDDKITALESEQKRLQEAVEKEKESLAGPKGNEKLGLKATIGVFADIEGEVEIAIIYAVYNATWDAHYDIRVSMQTKDKPVSVIYKGAITQSTGEDWNDAPIQLETAAPTFGVSIPELHPWTVSIYRPPAVKLMARKSKGGLFSAAPMMAASSRATAELYQSSTLDADEFIQHRGLDVSSKGNVTATFSVPGLMTIPSDGVAHNVTIVKLSLDAGMEWVTVPKQQSKVHLKAKVKNASQYTLLSGPASVYVDGSFISRSDVPLVSPEESFDCPLGIDPSIRVTYQPLSKKATQSGFVTRSSNTTFTQRILLHNTKSIAVDNVKVLDQIPVSEDSIITVKLISPPLESTNIPGGTVTSTSSGVENKSGVKVPPPVKVAQGIVAQWDGADDLTSEDDLSSLGNDGKISWVCSIPSQGKVTLTLQWEVSAPLKTNITGL